MTLQEKMQIEYLKKRRNELVDNFIGAVYEINAQIRDVRAGLWKKEMQEENKGGKDDKRRNKEPHKNDD